MSDREYLALASHNGVHVERARHCRVQAHPAELSRAEQIDEETENLDPLHPAV